MTELIAVTYRYRAPNDGSLQWAAKTTMAVKY